MLSIILGTTVYPVADAARLHEDCLNAGIGTSWWETSANTIHLVAGRGPSEAHLLLPYSTIKLLNDAAVSTGDEEGLDSSGVVETSPDGTGKNFYDRVIRIHRMFVENPDYGDPGEPQFLEEEQDLSGWVFVGSKAIDPSRNTQDDNTIHLARFTDIRGIYELISHPPGNNWNLVRCFNETPETNYDVWGFYNDPLIAMADQVYAWQNLSDELWWNICHIFPNDKYQTAPVTFDFPYYEPVSGGDYENNRPHNLRFKDLDPWDSYVEFCHKIFHEVFPEFDGTYRIEQSYAHTTEDFSWLDTPGSEVTGDDRPLAWQMGERLYARRYYLVDHEHPPRVVLVPHSFMAVFGKTPIDEEIKAVPEIVLWRGTGNTLLTGGNVPIETGSLFTQELLKDDTYFDPDSSGVYLDEHPYVFVGDYEGENGTDQAERSSCCYVDCTFYAVPTYLAEGEIADFTDIDDGLRTPPSENPLYPARDIARRIAKEHLKCILNGDLNTVVLSGFHDFTPTPRHQSVTFDAGIAGPTTVLFGKFNLPDYFPRRLKTDNLYPPDSFSDFAGIAVVVGTVSPASAASGASGDFGSFSQGSTSGEALPLRWDGTNLVPDIPSGADAADYYVPFRVVRNDVTISSGTLLFIKNKIGHILSACDYLRGAPTGTLDPDNDRFLAKTTAGVEYWASVSDVPGGGGGGGGDTVLEGYAIDLDGTGTVTIHNDPTEWSSWDKSTFQFFHHVVIAGTPVRTDPYWRSVSGYNGGEKQMWWHEGGTFKFQTTTNYGADADPDGSVDPQFIVNWDGDWQWVTVEGYSNSASTSQYQFFVNTQNNWKWETATGYDAAKHQLVGHDNAGNWLFRDDKTPTAIDLDTTGNSLRIRLTLRDTTVLEDTIPIADILNALSGHNAAAGQSIGHDSGGSTQWQTDGSC